MTEPLPAIRTPDQRLRVFVSSTIGELAPERAAVKQAIGALRLAPVLFEMGARPHPPRDLYRAYLEQSDIFVGIYWQSYGWVAPEEEISGLEDEYRLSTGKPRLIYLKEPAPERQERLKTLISQIRDGDTASYQKFGSAEELGELVANDLALMLTERFEESSLDESTEADVPFQSHNLPAVRGRLIGREEELADLLRLLAEPAAGLVTLTGPGGAGKTRLALEAVNRLIGRFLDGVWLVALAPVGDPSLVPATIARTLGIPEQAGVPIEVALTRYLREKSLLLLLDNFEQVIGAATFVADLLAACPGVRLLVTSRSPLRVRGEQELPVLPLSLSSTNGRVSPAVELFVERAREMQSDFSLGDENAAAVTALTERLDGLPLAIELAAARSRLLSPDSLLARLDRPLDLLDRGPRDLPVRQQALRDTIAWSHDLLDQEAKVLFRRLAVFRCGWTLEQAEAVCGEGLDDPLGALERLVDDSLVLRPERGNEPRYNMLETIGEFAAEQLVASGEEQTIRRRHAERMLQLSEAAFLPVASTQRIAALAQIGRDYENLQGALDWALGPIGDVEIGARIVSTLCWYWYFSSLFGDFRRWTDLALARLDDRPASESARARLLYSTGFSAFINGDPPRASARLNEAIRRFRTIDDEGFLPWSLAMSGLSLLEQAGSSPRADFDEALALFRARSDRWGEAFTLSFAAIVELNATDPGNFARSRAVLEQSIALFRETGDRWGEAMSMNSLCYVLLAEGRAQEAIRHFGEAVAMLRAWDDRWTLTWAVAGLGQALLESGNLAEARFQFHESLQLAVETGTYVTAATCTLGLGFVALLEGNQSRATELGAAGARLATLVPMQSWIHIRLARERGLVALQDQLSPALWQAAEERLAGLSADELVRLALAG